MVENRLGTESAGRLTVKRSHLDGMSLGVAVPAAVASRTDANVLDLDSLTGVVDVDALDAIWGASESGTWGSDARVTFPYMGYEISVTAEELHVEPIDDDRAASADPEPTGADEPTSADAGRRATEERDGIRRRDPARRQGDVEERSDADDGGAPHADG